MRKTRAFVLSILAFALLPSLASAQSATADAFDVRAQLEGRETLKLDWTVHDGYHLLRSKVQVEARSDTASLSTLKLPDGERINDPFFGEIDVLTGQFTTQSRVEPANGKSGQLEFEVIAQACAVSGECDPASAVRLSVALPGALTALPLDSAMPDQSPGLSEIPDDSQNPLEKLSKLGQSLLGDQGEPEFLDPEEAFLLSTEVRDDGVIVARWDIAPEYYLYNNKFDFKLNGAQQGTVREAVLSEGKVKEDEYFGTVEVHYGTALAQVHLNDVAAGPIELDVRYQGCADAGLCYPPITKTVALTLAAASGAAPASGDGLAASAGDLGAVEIPEQDRIAQALATSSLALILPLFFGFGLLLTFTPCVLPMVPILSGIIVGQGDSISTRRAFLLSLAYVMAMALTYTAVGVIAALFGANLQIVFQDPRVLIAFSVVFVLLALSMFGFYDLQLPAALQTRLTAASARQTGGTYVGAGIMGFLSALIVGPCVAAPLAGALIYIGNTGDAVLGGLALFALSLGMGVPLLLIGTSAGKLLPKAGPWMESIKAVFGVILLAVAIYLLERIVSEWVAMLLWAALFIVAAMYLGALDTLSPGAPGWRRFWKGGGLVLLVYGVLLMVGAAGGGGGDLFQPLRGIGLASHEASEGLEFKQVKGPDGLRAELAAAGAAGRPVMLDYYADWCVSCKEMEKLTFTDNGVRSALQGTVLLQTDVTANDELDQALLKEFGLFGPPAILFFGPDGRERANYRVVGFKNADDFRTLVEKATDAKNLRASQRSSALATEG